MTKLRILHVVDSLEFGGLERVVADLAMTQHQRGCQVAVLSINATAGLTPEIEQAGIAVIQGNKQGTLDWNVLSKIRALVKSMQSDVVHAHNFVPNYYAATALLGMRGRPVLVGTCHDMGSRLSQRKLRFMYKASLMRTRRVAMVGKQVHHRFVSQGYVKARDAVTVLNGVPIKAVEDHAASRSLARSALGIASDDLVIGAVGRLVELKNHALLIRLMPALVKSYPNIKLVIVGAGPLEHELKEMAVKHQIADRVVFAGQRRDVASVLHAFDVFAMPSLTEGLSIALLEAASKGLSIVATKVGGNVEIVEDGVTGLLVVPSDDSGTLQTLLTLLASPELRARIGYAAQRWVRENASLDAMCDAYDNLYRDALNAK